MREKNKSVMYLHLLIYIVMNYIIIFFLIYMFKNRVNEGEKKVLAIVISCPSDGLTLNLNISKIPFQVEILKCNYK